MRFPSSLHRRRFQNGIEAIEFSLLFVFLLPPFVWMFINGMNFLRFNKATDVSRSAALLFVKGIDFTLPGNQAIIARVASGLDLQSSSTTSASARAVPNSAAKSRVREYRCGWNATTSRPCPATCRAPRKAAATFVGWWA